MGLIVAFHEYRLNHQTIGGGHYYQGSKSFRAVNLGHLYITIVKRTSRITESFSLDDFRPNREH